MHVTGGVASGGLLSDSHLFRGCAGTAGVDVSQYCSISLG